MYNDIYKNKKVMVLGNTGFKGSFFADWLVSLNANVLGYSLFPNTNPNNFSFSKREYDTVFHDINDYNFLSETLFNLKPSIVFHFASQPVVSEAYADPITTLNTNIIGTVKLLDACRDVDSIKSIVIITSDKCYYNNEKGIAFKVGDTLAGLDPYCVHPDSCVETINGIKKIKDLIIGEKILGYKDKEVNFFEVKNIMIKNTTENIYKVNYKFGNIKISEHHTCLIIRPKRGINGRLKSSYSVDNSSIIEVKANELKKGDWLIVNRKSKFNNLVSTTKSLDLLRFYGFFVGNGNLKYSKNRKRKDLLICSKYKHLIDYYANIFYKEFGLTGTIYKHTTKDCWYFRVGASTVWDTFIQFGKGALHKNANIIMDYSDEEVKSFLGGFFDADGSFTQSKPVTSFSTSSVTLKNQITHLLKRIGCLSSIIGSTNKFSNNTNYKISLTDTLSQINFITQCKPLKYPISILSKNQKTLNQGDIAYIPFKNIEIIKNEYNYLIDIEVGECNNFFCDGVLVHNSASKSCAELIVDSYRYAFLKDKLVATVRAGNCIGGGDWAKNRIITDIVNAITTKSVLNIRNIDSIRPWSSLWDLLNGYLMVGQKLLEGKKEFARAWNFGPRAGAKLFTIGDIIKSFDKYWKAPEINLISNPIKESNILKLNSKETNEELGWMPYLSQDEIFKWTVEWYKNFYENNKIITEEQFNLFKEKIK